MATGLPHLTARVVELAEAYSLLATLAQVARDRGVKGGQRGKNREKPGVPSELVGQTASKVNSLLDACLDAKRSVDLAPLQAVHPEICSLDRHHALSWTELTIGIVRSTLDALAVCYARRDGSTELDTDAVAADWFNAASMVLALAISDASVLVNLVRKEVASIDELKLPPLDETPSAWPEVTPSELARLLGISLPKLRERTDNGGDIRVEKITQRRYKIHPDDLNRVRVTAVERERTKAMIQEARRASSN